MLHGLRTVGFHVTDLDAAKAWYTEVLGHGPYFDEPFYVGFDVGGYELGLLPADAAAGAGGTIAYWAVDDADAAHDRLVDLGAKPHHAVQDVGDNIRVGCVADPLGNLLGVIANPGFRARGATSLDGPIDIIEEGARLGAGSDVLSPRQVRKDVVVAASPAEIWPLWTTLEGMARWLGGESRIDPRIGGAFDYFEHAWDHVTSALAAHLGSGG